MSLHQAVVDNFKSITMLKAVPVRFDLGITVETPTEASTVKQKRSTKAKTQTTQEGE
jgi:hypothetical protein